MTRSLAESCASPSCSRASIACPTNKSGRYKIGPFKTDIKSAPSKQFCPFNFVVGQASLAQGAFVSGSVDGNLLDDGGLEYLIRGDDRLAMRPRDRDRDRCEADDRARGKCGSGAV